MWLASCPAAGPFPARPASAAGASTRAGGACPARPGTRSRMLTGPSRVRPVPEGDHGRSAIVVVMLRGLSGEAARAAGVTASLPGAVMDPAGPCPRAGPWAAARAPVPDPRARHAGIGPGEAGAAVTHRWACSPDRRRTSSQPDPARSMTGIRQPDSGKPRAHQIVWETREAQGSAAGAGKSGSSLDDLAPDSVRAAPGSA